MAMLDEKIYRMRDALVRMGAFATITDDLNFIGVTPSFTDLLGYEEEELQGKHISSIICDVSNSFMSTTCLRHIYRGGTWIGDIICRHKNGSAVEVRVSIAPSITDDNVIGGFIAQYQKTFSQRDPFELGDVLYRYTSGFNKIAGMAFITSSGEIQEVNDLFLEMFGHQREDLVGKHIGSLTRHDHLTEMPDHIWAAVSKGEVYTGEIAAYRSNGQCMHLRMTVTPANDVPADVASDVIASFDSYLVILQDITEEWEMRTSQREQAIESARQQMLAGAIHNISNLQQGVLSANAKTTTFAQSLATACEAASAHVKAITDQQDREAFLDGMTSIIRNSVSQILASVQEERRAIDETVAVLNSFRREQKNIRLVVDESISSFVQHILNTFSLQAARHNIAVSISSMIDADVRWPMAQVHQIVLNLLINAQQAIAERVEAGMLPAHRGRIELAILEEGANIILYVKDNGGGFDVPLHVLFTPRFTTKESGSGIGLHTSAIMAQSMGGTLTAENSDINGVRGARFILTIPRMISPKGQS